MQIELTWLCPRYWTTATELLLEATEMSYSEGNTCVFKLSKPIFVMEITHLLKERTWGGLAKEDPEGEHSKQGHRLSKWVIWALRAWNGGNPCFWFTCDVPSLGWSFAGSGISHFWAQPCSECEVKVKPLPTPKTSIAFDTVLFLFLAQCPQRQKVNVAAQVQVSVPLCWGGNAYQGFLPGLYEELLKSLLSTEVKFHFILSRQWSTQSL